MRTRLPVLLAALALMAAMPRCGSSSSGSDAGPEVTEVVGEAQDAAAEVPQDAVEETGPALRHYNFRVVGGASMGANGAMITAHHPGLFDAVGALGGYYDGSYLAHMITGHFLGGFCPMEQILANLDEINNPAGPGSYCGAVPPSEPYEFAWDFNHLHYDEGGGRWHRDFYYEVVEGMMMAFGNFLYWNPENPYFPPGVTRDWWLNEPDKCANPAVVGKPNNFNAEYNPQGEYDLITFCDNETPVPCYNGDPTKCGQDNPDYWELAGDYRPEDKHTQPRAILLAVDYNHNRQRDYGEPVISNASERWRDVGPDGCGDTYEDGQGGCSATETAANAGQDPNGDGFDLYQNPAGTEGNGRFDQGEPFDDYGLDGVPESVAGFKDFGEGDGRYSRNPYFEVLVHGDVEAFMRTAALSSINKTDWFFDGGIRDALHALLNAEHVAIGMRERGLEVKAYDDFTVGPNSILPGVNCGSYLFQLHDKVDLSPAGFGRNVLVRYGDPDATVEAIHAGDGTHVGTGCQVAARAGTFFQMALWRLPDPVVASDGDKSSRNVYRTYYSHSLQNRRWYGVAVPAGYDKPENATLTYPVGYVLSGHGMGIPDTLATGIAFTGLGSTGKMPRFLQVVPDGQCCFIRKSDGVRHCGCLELPGTQDWTCVDPTCTGEHEECATEVVKGNDLDEECNRGHFFADHHTDRWGNPAAAGYMKYESAFVELLDEIDSHFRARPPADLPEPQ
jgi:hypothetical protein